MNTDLDYAVKQLQGIDLKVLHGFGHLNAADRVQRALDALERMQDEQAALTVPFTEADLKAQIGAKRDRLKELQAG